MLNNDLLDGPFPLGVALSGGSDSTALLCLMSEAFGAQNLRAVTVDHGLRAGAAQEALDAAKFCARLGVAHDILRLDLSSGSDLQARARQARYEALGGWAGGIGVSAVALGHTRDDVSETFLMRLSRGSGVDGLARMPERFSRDGTVFLRPLLEASRAELRTLLHARAVPWSEDPSNEDARFTRVRIRQAAPQLSALGLSPERLSQTAKWMRAASEVLEQAAEAWIAVHARAEHGDAVLERAALRAAPFETAGRVLSRVLCNIANNPYRPRLAALQNALQSDVAITLHGCLIYPQGTELRVTREFRAITHDETRWTVVGDELTGCDIAPLGEAGLSQIGDWRSTALLPRRSLLSSPAIWQGARVIAAPLARPDDRWSATAPNPLRLPK